MHAQREIIYLVDIYGQHEDACCLIHKAWQDVDAEQVGKAKLIWCDPFYQPEYQPSHTERGMMRNLLDEISVEGTVVLIFGRMTQLFNQWVPIFVDGLENSKVKWKMDSNIFTVHRAPLRDKHTNNTRVWHSRTEHAITFTKNLVVIKTEFCPKLQHTRVQNEVRGCKWSTDEHICQLSTPKQPRPLARCGRKGNASQKRRKDPAHL
jgi:hypothetical protein